MTPLSDSDLFEFNFNFSLFNTKKKGNSTIKEIESNGRGSAKKWISIFLGEWC